jgi:hypothetical protein
MAIDPLHLTLQTLTNKNAALDRATTALKNQLNGDFNHDAPIQQRLASIHAEQSHIASRIAAISQSQPFTPPTDAQVNALGSAISTLDADVKASANVTALMTAATSVMKQYGAASSQLPPKPEAA